jgi:hypothetical protein
MRNCNSRQTIQFPHAFFTACCASSNVKFCQHLPVRYFSSTTFIWNFFFPNRRNVMLMWVYSLIRAGLYSNADLCLNRCTSPCKDIRCNIYSKSFQLFSSSNTRTDRRTALRLFPVCSFFHYASHYEEGGTIVATQVRCQEEGF